MKVESIKHFNRSQTNEDTQINKIRSIFDLNDNSNQLFGTKSNYNQIVYFNPNENEKNESTELNKEKELKMLITNVISNSLQNESKKKESIKVNVSINNNYYNSGYYHKNETMNKEYELKNKENFEQANRNEKSNLSTFFRKNFYNFRKYFLF